MKAKNSKKKTKKQKTLNEKLEALAKAAHELAKEMDCDLHVEANQHYGRAAISDCYYED